MGKVWIMISYDFYIEIALLNAKNNYLNQTKKDRRHYNIFL